MRKDRIKTAQNRTYVSSKPVSRFASSNANVRKPNPPGSRAATGAYITSEKSNMYKLSPAHNSKPNYGLTIQSIKAPMVSKPALKPRKLVEKLETESL